MFRQEIFVYIHGHVNICVGKNDKGTLLFYDCGSTKAIQAVEPIEREYARSRFQYAVRPNDAIANSLGTAKTSEKLQDKIEKYINENIKEGKYSVSYIDTDYSDKRNVSINDSKVSTNGWLKLFVMATAFDEIANGNDKINPIYIENMIRYDTSESTTTYAKNVLTTLGDGDINKGISKVNSYASSNGYANTHIDSMIKHTQEVNGNYTSVSDVAKLLMQIKNGNCVSASFSEKMLQYLQETQRETNKEMIPIPEGGTGSGGHMKSEINVGNGKKNIQDAAIISIDKANYVVAISAEDAGSDAKTHINAIAKMVNDYFATHGKLDSNDDADIDDEIQTRLNGRRVCYKQRDTRWICPLSNLVEGREILFKLLARREKTQSYERFMRYVLYLLTGNDYGVTKFDIHELFGENNFTEASGGIIGNTTKEKVFWTLYNFLIKNGISDAQARISVAGAMGNIEGESGFRPDAVEYPSGEGHGLCQWSFDRKTRLLAYAKSKGVSWKDENLQLEYLLGELTPGGGCRRKSSL